MNTFLHRLAASAVLSLAGFSGVAAAAPYTDYATILRVTPLYEEVRVSREECERGATSAPDERGIGGTLIGGLAGAAVGSRFGKGSGNAVAIGAGAIGGALLGDRMQNGGGNAAGAARCHQVDRFERRESGYQVDYSYAGREFSAQMSAPPRGSRLPVNVDVFPAER